MRQVVVHAGRLDRPERVVRLGNEKAGTPTSTLGERVAHVVQSAFDGRRVILFSGGPAKGTAEVLEEIRGIRDGGGFGSIIGRNAFQRERGEALELLDQVVGIYQGRL